MARNPWLIEAIEAKLDSEGHGAIESLPDGELIEPEEVSVVNVEHPEDVGFIRAEPSEPEDMTNPATGHPATCGCEECLASDE